MIRIENIDMMGIDHAIRGMRNPLNSWDKSDSNFKQNNIGENDLALMRRLFKAGTDHRKFMRMIVVYMDITAPLYWWKEFDTYKVGTVANSCSTMHKIHDKKFEIEDFSREHLLMHNMDMFTMADDKVFECSSWDFLHIIVTILNKFRQAYLETKDKQYWWQMIQLLPSSYNQKRTVILNFEVLANIYKSRKSHKLDEWRIFCDTIIEEIPLFKQIIIER